MHVWIHFRFDGHRKDFVEHQKTAHGIQYTDRKFEVSSNVHLFNTFSSAGGNNPLAPCHFIELRSPAMAIFG